MRYLSKKLIHFFSGWVWHLISLFSIMKSLILPTEHVAWPRQPLTMPSPIWTPSQKKAIKILHWSCNCWGTTWHSGPPICKPKVKLLILIDTKLILATWIDPNFVPWGPTKPDLTWIWTLGARLEIRFKLGSLGFIKYTFWLNPFWGQPDSIKLVFLPWDPKHS